MQLKCLKSKKIMNEIEYTHFEWLTLWLENWIPCALFSPSHPTCTTRNCDTLKKEYQAYTYTHIYSGMVSTFILLQSQLSIAEGSICHLFSHRGCGQSSPFSFEHLWIRSRQSVINNSESVLDSPSLGKNDWSLEHPEMCSLLREMSLWRDRKAKDSRFLKLEMKSSARVVGRSNGWWWW